jgi:hypothetical protein
MRSKQTKKLYIAGGLLAAFILWTVLVRLTDVRPIGPNGSSVGFASLNGFVHSLTGVSMILYTITDWLGLIPLCIVLGFAMLIFLPRFMRFAEMANEEKMAMSSGAAQTESIKVGDMRKDGADGQVSITLYEKHGDIDFTEFQSLTPEAINEIEEWNRQNPSLNIYDDDVEIENYKKVKGGSVN